jgi:phospholipid N-methyltransferase
MTCCNNGLSDVFTDKSSRRDARKYRRKGLPARARKLLAAIGSLENRTTLEIGVGAGGVTVEMLRRGASHSTGVDAVAGQLEAARKLAQEFQVADRAEFVLGDFTERDVANADIVVLDRVVCCYPDWRALLTSAIVRANNTLAMTYPQDDWIMHTVSRGMSAFWKLRRSEFRFRVHPATEMHAFLRANGFAPKVTSRYFGWEIMVAERAAG